ncbi:tetratricopeptide repeat protein [Aquimarina algicola]|uniref:Tetratricopeptide repeat protein n=1 Tax=Aquimarina algicola TaxID=2589995 RepID=A0A504J3G6_9FLAO|nr:tetratricopeptide repeat protein [Aquimarina algicola]TPN81230.1 tetratricopeptide repeat protein [Aquimarina algicola]
MSVSNEFSNVYLDKGSRENIIYKTERLWKTITVDANTLFEQHKFKEALNNYKNALRQAEILNNYKSECIQGKIPFIQLYIISCNNIAYTYIELKLLEKAGDMFKRTIYYLLYLLDYDCAGIERELKRAVATYLDYSVKYEKDDDSQNKILSDIKEHFSQKQLSQNII